MLKPDFSEMVNMFIRRTVMSNEARTTEERTRLTAERRGILDSIELMYGQAQAGEAIMAADRHYHEMARSMTGGLWHDWAPIHRHVNRGNETDVCKTCGNDLFHESHARLCPECKREMLSPCLVGERYICSACFTEKADDVAERLRRVIS